MSVLAKGRWIRTVLKSGLVEGECDNGTSDDLIISDQNRSMNEIYAEIMKR